MKIGILTYHNIPNFGANLQAYTSFKTFEKMGLDIKIIDYLNPKLKKEYEKKVSKKQISVNEKFINEKYLTKHCKNENELKMIIDEEKFTHIIVGSDAVMRIKKNDMLGNEYPNAFWLNWISSDKNIKKIFLSASSMGSYYPFLEIKKIRKIRKNLKQFDLITVRDRWTYWIMNLLAINSSISPDPVSNLNFFLKPNKKPSNFSKITKNKKFILFSGNKKNYSKKWLLEFKKEVNKKNLLLGELPMPEGYTGLNCFDFKIPAPLDPIDWYLWISNSNGYLGERFHALITCAYNKKPFFIIDNYCNNFWKILNFEYKSKIYDFCKNINQTENRVIGKNILNKSPQKVLYKLLNTDYKKSNKYLEKSKNDFLNLAKKIASLK